MIPNRLRRLEELIRSAIAEILLREIQDPRLESLTITEVRVASDARFAKVYWVVRGRSNERRKARDGLDAAAGRIRHELAGRIRGKHVPVLSFHMDDRYDTAERVQRLIGELGVPSDEKESGGKT